MSVSEETDIAIMFSGINYILGAEARALILVGYRVLTPSRLTTPRFAFFRQPPTILGHYSCQKPSIMAADPRHIVSSMVETKACHVMNLAECSRHYGSNSKTKRVQGIVTHLEVIKNSTTNRTTTFVTAAYDLAGTTIHPCRLNIQSVKAVPTPTVVTVTTAGGTLIGSTDGDSTMTEAMTPPVATEPTLEAPMNIDTLLEDPTAVVLREPPPLTTKNNNNIIVNNDTPLPQHTELAATVHDQEWFVDDPVTKLPVNGNYQFCNWAIKTKDICSDEVETTKTHTHVWNMFDVISTRTTSANPTINK